MWLDLSQSNISSYGMLDKAAGWWCSAAAGVDTRTDMWTCVLRIRSRVICVRRTAPRSDGDGVH